MTFLRLTPSLRTPGLPGTLALYRGVLASSWPPARWSKAGWRCAAMAPS